MCLLAKLDDPQKTNNIVALNFSRKSNCARTNNATPIQNAHVKLRLFHCTLTSVRSGISIVGTKWIMRLR